MSRPINMTWDTFIAKKLYGIDATKVNTLTRLDAEKTSTHLVHDYEALDVGDKINII